MLQSKVDVLVAGGGPAGVSAAVSAAKNGASVRIIDSNGFFGGTLISGIVGAFCGMFSARRSMEDQTYQIVQGIGEEIRKRAYDKGGLSRHNHSRYFDSYSYDPCILPIVLDELILKYDVRPSLHSLIIGAAAENGTITEVTVASKSGIERVSAGVVVDCTGDADIVHFSGGSYRKNTDQLQPGSFNFRMCGVDGAKGIPTLPEVAEAIRNAVKNSPKSYLLREDSMFIHPVSDSEVICGFSRLTVDGTDTESLTKAEIDGRRQVLPVAQFIRETFPAFRNARVCNLAFSVGIRETRVIEGVGKLTDDDVYYGRSQPDGIGKCAWPVERHVAGGKHTEVVPLAEGDAYDIPFSALIPVGCKNLLAAGRCVSSERAANASVRVFGPCTATGEAAGAAAAQFIADKASSFEEIDIPKLRQTLEKNGALI
jgi:hypothetical protein